MPYIQAAFLALTAILGTISYNIFFIGTPPGEEYVPIPVETHHTATKAEPAKHGSETASVAKASEGKPAPSGPPTCHLKTTTQSGKTMEYTPGEFTSPDVVVATLPETVTFTWESTNATSATGPHDEHISLNGKLTIVPDKVSTLTTSYLFRFEGPYGKAVCQGNVKVANPIPLPEDTLIPLTVDYSPITNPASISVTMPDNIAKTFDERSTKQEYALAFTLVPIFGSGKSISLDNYAWGGDQKSTNGPVIVGIAGGALPGVAKGSYKLRAELYAVSTNKNSFDILRILRGKGESKAFMLP